VRENLLGVVAGIFCIVALATSSFLFLARSGWYEHLIVASTGIDLDNASEHKLTRRLVADYLFTDRVLAPELFSERERLHMTDVKRIFREIETVAFVAFAVFFLLTFVLRKSPRFVRAIYRASVTSLIGIGVGSVVCLIFFDSIFTAMHRFLFANDFWLLDPATDRIIRAFPGEYFLTFTIGYGVILTALVALLAFTANVKSKTTL